MNARLATYGAFWKARLQDGQPLKTALARHTEVKKFLLGG
jgi:phage-related protein